MATTTATAPTIVGSLVPDLILAWVLTLPVCVILGAATFGAGLFVMFRMIGVH